MTFYGVVSPAPRIERLPNGDWVAFVEPGLPVIPKGQPSIEVAEALAELNAMLPESEDVVPLALTPTPWRDRWVAFLRWCLTWLP